MKLMRPSQGTELKNKASSDLKEGRTKTALKKAVLGTKKYPKDADFWTIAGISNNQLGLYQKSLFCCKKAFQLRPERVDYAENLAAAFEALGDTAKACEVISLACIRHPENDSLKTIFLETLYRGEEWEEVIEVATEMIEAGPQNGSAHFFRNKAYSEMGYVNESDLDKKKAYDLSPGDLLIATEYGHSLNQKGLLDEANGIYWDTLNQHPQAPDILIELSAIAEGEDEGKVAALIESARLQSDIPIYELEYAFANIIAKAEGLGAAMPAYASANKIQQKVEPFDPKDEATRLRRATKIFSPALSHGEWPKAIDPVPIFIIGQPRSGTTLLEMMLSSSPHVHGCGEMNLGPKLARRFIFSNASFGPEDASQFASEYRRLIPGMPLGALAFIDKLPHNYRVLGFLAKSFPNAKFVNLLRDPRDVALSTWIKRFPASGMRYASDLSVMAACANDYRRYMNYWDKQFSDQILTVRYEELVSDPETYGKIVTRFAGIPWDPAILHPEKNTASVKTASMWQVRNKIGVASIGKWKPHAAHLQGFIDKLYPRLWPEYDFSPSSYR